MQEFLWIDKYLRPLASQHAAAKNLSDDAAHFNIHKDFLATAANARNQTLVVSCDTLVAGVHFFADDAPFELAQKALRVNLSDIAAKGAKPYGFFCAISMPHNLGESWAERFCAGLQHDMQEFELALFGGDTTSAPQDLTITITMFGLTERSLLRSDAKVGDVVAVSGTIGQGYCGLKAAQSQRQNLAFDPQALAHYHVPSPRCALGQALSQSSGVHACMDVSDGLLADARHMARASKLCLRLYLAQIPLYNPQQWINEQLSGGDDYELLFTASTQAIAQLQSQGFHAYVIGDCIKSLGQGQGQDLILLDAQGQTLTFEKLGYSHG